MLFINRITYIKSEEEMSYKTNIASLAAAAAFVVLVALPDMARAHCDTMDGPVVADARAALEKGDITPALKWVKSEGENEVRAAFLKALVVRGQGRDAQELADLFFFETLVRVHRAGEGAPYTGLKPAGVEFEPGIKASDKALESGSVDALTEELTAVVSAGVRELFERAYQAKAHAEHNVEAGRRFVAAYVEFVHYIERLHSAAAADAAHQVESDASPVHEY